MASSSQTQKIVGLARNSKKLFDTNRQRKYATHADLPRIQPAPKRTIDPFNKPVIVTTYRWPSIQPVSLKSYSGQFLDVPLRKDILHRAVVFEADEKRAGLASTKHRSVMRGSDRKLRPQKGSGRARLSDRKSPMLRGGGVAHGPHPRDFSTDLPKQIYNLALRTALSHRYRRGELVVLKNKIHEENAEQTPRWLDNIFTTLQWGAGHGRTVVVVEGNEKSSGEPVYEMMRQIGKHVILRKADEVEVKDLLSCGRVVIESLALDQLMGRVSQGAEHLLRVEPVGRSASSVVAQATGGDVEVVI